MKTPRRIRIASGLPALMGLALAVAPAAPAWPQEPDAAPLRQQVADQEGAVYGRLRFVEGGVTLKRDNEVTTDLVINDPLAPGDVFTTQQQGRAEIQLADGSTVKLDYDSELVLQSLSDSSNQIENTTILQLPHGSLIVEADEMDSSEKRFQIDTDGASVFLLSDGLFRIDVRSDGTTVVSSRRGVAEVMSQEVSSLVRSGERIAARPEQIPGEARVFNTRLRDDFDLWAADRDESLVRRARVDDQAPAGLPEPVEPYTDELSFYGHWYNNPSYGWVWRPVGLGPEWQPYLYGRWVDCPTGMVWVSYEPWGWAPFHYGRWEFLLGTGWVWIPGHVFSGAYVAWGVAPGYFGWCPLGYYDVPAVFSFNIGFHRDPWVYVGAQNIYARRINTVIVRDVTVVREIETRRVIIRGRPVIDPRRVKEAPRLATELHDVARDRPGLRLEPASARRLPFRENERQKLVEMNNRRPRGNNEEPRGMPVARGGAGRSVTVMPTDRRVNVPRGRSVEPPSSPAPGSAAPGGQSRGQVRGNAPDDRRQQTGPRKDQQPRGEALPERVIPRIIPRPGAEADNRRPAPPAPRREARETAPGSRPGPPSRTGAQPRQGKPKGQEAARPSQPKQERSRGNGGNNGGNKGGDKGGDKGGQQKHKN